MGTHDGHRQRLKTEFLARPDSFPDHKLLELLLFYANPRSDTNPLAHELIDRFGSLAGVLDAAPEELCKVSGMGEHGAVLLKAAKELAGRYLTARTRVDDIARNSRDYYALLRPYFFGAGGGQCQRRVHHHPAHRRGRPLPQRRGGGAGPQPRLRHRLPLRGRHRHNGKPGPLPGAHGGGAGGSSDLRG